MLGAVDTVGDGLIEGFVWPPQVFGSIEICKGEVPAGLKTFSVVPSCCAREYAFVPAVST